MFDDRKGLAMVELVAPPVRAAATSRAGQDHLGHVISRVAAGDRAAFRRLYAFMAMRVWHIVANTPLCATDGIAVTRSTFLEVWHSARAAPYYDARDWMARVTSGRVADRLRIADPNGRHGIRQVESDVGTDRRQQPTLVDYDAHVHRELNALLGDGAATIRTGPGVFIRIDHLDLALATIAAATRATAATGSTDQLKCVATGLRRSDARK